MLLPSDTLGGVLTAASDHVSTPFSGVRRGFSAAGGLSAALQQPTLLPSDTLGGVLTAASDPVSTPFYQLP